MPTLSPLHAILSPVALHASWRNWQDRTENTVVAGVIRVDRPSPDLTQRIRPHTAVVTYQGIDGHTTTVPFERDHTQRAEAVVLDAFEHFYALAEQSIIRPALYIDHSGVRAETRRCAASFPAVVLTASPLGCLSELFHAAGRALPEVPKSSKNPDPTRSGKRESILQVATDASKRRGRAGVGISAVDAAGRVYVDYLPDVESINLGECLAIEMAVRRHTGQLEILTDSLHVATYLQSNDPDVPRWLISSHAGRVRALREKLQRTGSTVRWVRGHDGHPLNEAAHRAAIAVRRNNEFDVSPTVASDMYRRIGGDAVQLVAA